MKLSNAFIAIGALGCMFGVAFGAFGAHALEQVVTPERMVTWGKGVDYLFIHSLGLALMGLLEAAHPRTCHRVAGGLMLAGAVLFSGSLFALVLSGMTWLGMITPVGGVAFLAAWLLLAVCYLLAD